MHDQWYPRDHLMESAAGLDEMEDDAFKTVSLRPSSRPGQGVEAHKSHHRTLLIEPKNNLWK